jgi:amino acid adenylation domain-containing protein
MYGAFAEALACWSGSRHFTLNMMISNRLPLHPQVDQLVGNFAALVFLEIDLRGEGTFAQRAGRIQDQMLRDLEHRYVGGVEVLQALSRAQGHAGGAVVPIVVASSLHMKKETGPDDLIAYGRPTEFSCLETPQTWLDHQFYELADDALYIVWDVQEGIFIDGVIDAVWSAYLGLIERLCVDQRAWQAEHTDLMPRDHARVVQEANRTDRPIAPALLHTAFFNAAREHADRSAIITSHRTLSYRELAQHVNRIGRRLRELGARPNELVAVVMEKGWEQIAAAMGILASGAGYVPIDASFPEPRRDHLLERAGARLVVTQRKFQHELSWPEPVRVITVDDLAAVDDGPLASVQTPDDLAYVIYTSGSTGTPKGVAIDHRAAWNTIRDVNERFGVRAHDRVLAVSSLGFDLSVYDVFGLLAVGGAIVVPDAGASRDPEHWLELMIHQGVTLWNSAPALMQLLLESEGSRPGALPELGLVLLSGDWIAVTMPDAVRRLAPRARVVSLGGATEASIWSIYHPIDAVDPTWTSIPYGRPLANQRWRILDSQLEPCPLWVTGELYIAGDGLARGYWRDPARTAESFLVHPDGERLYRTGDLGRYLPDGTIEFLGRHDHQVKIQGFRVELGEVEAALLRHPAVREAVVIAQDLGPTGKTLIGFAVLAQGTQDQVTADGLRAFLAGSLPNYLVPTVIALLDAMPLTRNGKIDRGALPKLGQRAAVRAYEPPANELESQLAEIWQEVLDVPAVGRKDDFFELGGQSFAAVRAVARIRQRLGVRISVGAVFEARTIEALARSLGARDRWSPLVTVQRPGAGAGPASFWVHPAGGNVLCYHALARAMGSDRPMYAFQAAGLGGEQAPLTTVEDMAELYLQALKRVQPSGPYLIGGWSSGGVIAFELARRLEAAGDTVQALVLVDAPPPNAGLDLADDQLDAWFLQDLGGELPAGIDEAHLQPIRAVFKINLRAVQRHSPGTVAAHTIVVRATEGIVGEYALHPDRGAADWGWSRYVKGRLTAIDAPATHYTLLTPPHVADVSSKILRAIEG